MNSDRDSDRSDGVAPGPRILYLAHDLDDAAIWRRVAMLRAGGAEVMIAGFRRGSDLLPEPAIILGQTYNAQMAQRVLSVLKARVRLTTTFADTATPDAILCRNLEMLALAVPLRRTIAQEKPVQLVYEVLDIHRLMVGHSPVSQILRWIERQLCKSVDRLILSSPGFQREYFNAYGQCAAPVHLVENKVVLTGSLPKGASNKHRSELRIGWFGILRCRFSLDCLDQLTRDDPGRYKVILRGRPALDELTDFHQRIAANPDLVFEGPYSYPDDLADIYSDIDLAWLIDQYDTGKNSDWLLPNRLYESGLSNVPPIALNGTETARRLDALGTGLIVDRADYAAVRASLTGVTPKRLAALKQAQSDVPANTWRSSQRDCHDLVAAVFPPPPQEYSNTTPLSVLIVVPTLNEAAHIESVIQGLVGFLERRKKADVATRLVVADGGSIDGTQEIVADLIARLSRFDIHLMHNPARLQSAAVNGACDRFGDGLDCLVRMDAHAGYPQDYVDILLQEAVQTKADSIVVSMNATGQTPMQNIIAATQNSRLGNGGSAHRLGGAGRYVDHGHHALIRLEAFRFVGGYDPDFSHNEDAELDLRLARAGYRIWLTGRTGLDYYPRRSVPALFRQYFNFGRGRARTTIKHRLLPRLRQLVMIAIAPLVALAMLTPVSPVFAIPAAVWFFACLGAGVAMTIKRGDLSMMAAGPVAAAMHLGWSLGFWRQVLEGKSQAERPMSTADQKPASVQTNNIVVGICTFRRDSLRETLASLDRQVLADGTRMTIIVADNDETPSAQDLVTWFAKSSRHKVIYRFAPAGNISVARNAALEEAERAGISVFAFLDDDELAPPNWLRSLTESLAATGADAVVGPVRGVYSPDAPDWMQKLRIHDTIPELTPQHRPIAGHSCNVAMNLSSAAFAGRRFDLNRGVSGGEDTAFFKAAMEQGAQLAFDPQAWLEEPVVPSRATFNWLLKRRFRMGQTHGSLLRQHRGPVAGLLTVPLAMAKVAYCAGLAVLCLAVASRRNANLLRGALHCGTIAALVGIRDIPVYGTAQNKARHASS